MTKLDFKIIQDAKALLDDPSLPDNSKTWHKGKCACPSPERYDCYSLRYPNQMELDGREYCECPCHEGYDDDCDCYECNDAKIV